MIDEDGYFGESVAAKYDASSSAEFQKITQVVPVRVAITDPRGLPLLPGMNVTVRIHRG